jgi:two-component system, NarL family, nitrate/nitrite response regulator NarL
VLLHVTIGGQSLHVPSSHTQKLSFRSSDGSRWGIPNPHKHDSGLTALDNPDSTFLVLIADRDSMSSDLLATRLTRDGGIRATAVRSADLMDCMAKEEAKVVVIGADLNLDTKTGFDLAQMVRRAHREVRIVMLLNQSTQDDVITAFRSGACGVFSRNQPVTDFVGCIEHVGKGFIWAGPRETAFLLEGLRSIPSPDLSAAADSSPLTMRELQVVKCAARGKTNKVIACELGLSEHTVKNYLFRAFEKIGVSNRVELLFYLTQSGHTFGVAGNDDSETDPQTD